MHWLHERRGIRFALCGSSARKLRRGHSNLLGGRARRYELFGLVSAELGHDFDLDRMIAHGTLPSIYLADDPEDALRAYVGDYLREEVAAAGLVRNLPAFASFLEVAALSDAELVNASTFARDTGVSVPTIQSYLQILVDTLLGRWLPAYRKRPKRRVIGLPKFYFSDVGVVNTLAKRGQPKRGSEAFGKAFENWVFHELTAHIGYTRKQTELAYWRLASGIEVDFIVGDMACAIEAKASARVTSDHLKGLRSLVEDHRSVRRRIVVCLERTARKTEDGIEIVPAETFARELWAGDVV